MILNKCNYIMPPGTMAKFIAHQADNGASDVRFNRGKGKDRPGMAFGYLTALEPTDKRDRKDIVWRCQCKCGNIVELPATRLLVGNALSCGCLLK